EKHMTEHYQTADVLSFFFFVPLLHQILRTDSRGEDGQTTTFHGMAPFYLCHFLDFSPKYTHGRWGNV
ncbi:hypothetical protein ACJX0J_025589, partial [Zea mays]